jgi:hypothetical protein
VNSEWLLNTSVLIAEGGLPPTDNTATRDTSLPSLARRVSLCLHTPQPTPIRPRWLVTDATKRTRSTGVAVPIDEVSRPASVTRRHVETRPRGLAGPRWRSLIERPAPAGDLRQHQAWSLESDGTAVASPRI